MKTRPRPRDHGSRNAACGRAASIVTRTQYLTPTIHSIT
jgi:hypothetical protein